MDFVQNIRMDYGAEIQYLQRTFSALRPEHLRPIRNIEDGDDIDFDRMIQAKVEQRVGRFSSKFYIRRNRQERDTVVAFLLDMSSSTNELAGPSGKRILTVEKEALVLISEAINALGDTFGIFGFSGYGREQVAFYIAKDFTAPWNESTCRKIGRMSWKMENRDGTAIRHCVHKLSQRPEKSKLLILLSDGKPLDCGSEEYSGSYAQGDTREALQQARTMGIRPFCITIDPYGQKYLGAMYGESNFIIIDSVDSLPIKISSIYRRLTR